MALSHDELWPRTGSWPPPRPGGSAVAILGIPTWRTSLSPSGAHATPAAVRSALIRYGSWPAAEQDVADWGDIEDPDADEMAAVDFVGAVPAQLLIVLGGDNAATVPAALGRWGSSIPTAGLLTLDAHHDLRDGVSNGSPVRRLLHAGLSGSSVAQVGIADFANSAAYAQRAADHGITIFRRDELHRRPMAEVMADALEVAASAGGPVHVDLDVDVCDRSVAPACPASVPGGIAAWELRAAARAAGRHPAVTSVDITEVDATADSSDERTVRLAALCVLEILAGFGER